MDAEQFLAEFGHISNAPGGMGKLRELVIQLAISGRLVERIESEAPVSLVVEAAAELRRAYEDKLDLRSTRMQPPLHSRPFPVPDHWQWTRLEQICLYIQRGKSPKYVEKSSTQVISQKCVQWSGFDLSSARFVADDSLDSYGKERFLCTGDLLWNSTGTGTAGRVAIYQSDEDVTAVADSHVTVVRLANCSPRYLWCVIASPWVQSRIEPSHPDSLVSGTTQQVELNTSTARALPIPLPPIEEQSRIVAKVDELIALCDKLEAQQQARRKLQNNLRQSTLQAVASATSPHELQTTWARLADNFGRLFHAPADVKELRNLIFQLGIQGLLVDQCEIDQKKSNAFVRAVQEKRDRLVANGVIRRSTSFPAVEREVPFALPRGWKFCRLGEVSICRDGQRIPLSKAEREPRRGKFPYYGASGIIDHISDYIFDENLLLVGEDGANLVNRSTPIAFIATGRYWVNNHAHVLDTVDSVALRYLELFINAIDLKPYVTGTAQPKMNQEKMNLIVVAVPPPEEQALIVGRIDALMRFCDALEETLSDAVKTAERVAVSAVSSLTGIATEQEEEPMKAPQTELIASLRLGTAPDIKAQAPLATILARHNGEMSAKDLWQRFGGEIDAFYAQLKTEVAEGWILEPAVAEMREKQADAVST